MWITSGSIANVAVVWANAKDEKVRGFWLKRPPGFKAWDGTERSLRRLRRDEEISSRNVTIAERKVSAS